MNKEMIDFLESRLDVVNSISDSRLNSKEKYKYKIDIDLHQKFAERLLVYLKCFMVFNVNSDEIEGSDLMQEIIGDIQAFDVDCYDLRLKQSSKICRVDNKKWRDENKKIQEPERHE